MNAYVVNGKHERAGRLLKILNNPGPAFFDLFEVHKFIV